MQAAVGGQAVSGGRSAGLVKLVGGCAWRAVVCAMAYVVGSVAAGGLGSALGLSMPKLPGNVSQEEMGQLMLPASLVLVAGLAPLARFIGGGYVARWLSLAALACIALGVNTAIEASVFTAYGGFAGMLSLNLPPVVACTATIAGLFRPAVGGAAPAGLRGLFSARAAGQWVWRVPLAWLAFPAAYYVFGTLLMAVRLDFLAHYQSGDYGLRVPSAAVVLQLQLARSALFLASVLPALALWTGSRRGLVGALGLAQWVTVGLFGMVMGAWLPAEMRIGHGLEIGADSFAYSCALVGLLVPRKGRRG